MMLPLFLLLLQLAVDPFAVVCEGYDAPRPIRIVLAGDSTVTDRYGWGLGYDTGYGR